MALIAGGMDAIDAAELVARAAVEMTAGTKQRTAASIRQERYRRNKASQNVTRDADDETSQNVTNRNEVTLGDNAPLSKNLNRKRGERLSQSWTPSETDRGFAKDLGWTESQIDAESANFRDYWIAKPGADACKLDWPATWRKWVRSSKVKPAGSGGSELTPDKIPIEQAVEIYAKSGVWSRHAPVNDISQAPPELLAKHKILPDGRRIQ